MTLKRRFSIFSCALLILLATVAGLCAVILWRVRPLTAAHSATVYDRYSLDGTLMILCAMTCAGVAMTLLTAIITRRAILRRIREFQLHPGAACTSVNDQARDEFDHAAQRLNE